MVVVIYLAVLVAAFFFLIVLPQRRRLAAHRALLAALGPGDEIVTSGGLHATVRSLDDSTAQVEIAPGVVVTILRGAIAARRTSDRPDDEVS